jgi:transposase-like protein
MARRKARSRQSKQTKQSNLVRAGCATGRYAVAEKEVILKQVDAGRTQAEVAKQYGCHPTASCRWMRARDEVRPSPRSGSDSRIEQRAA